MTSQMMLLPVVHCENCRRGNDEELGLDLYDTESIHFLDINSVLSSDAILRSDVHCACRALNFC